MQTPRRLAATAAVLAITLAGATACGEDEPAPDSSGDPKTIEITFEDGMVTPNGERVKVDVDQEVELVVQADDAGEIHVHSTPEQMLEYGAGTTTLPITLDQPGVVEVESHDLDQVIVQLEVR
ncbi:hypothetical protein GGQ22_04250 [Nocardioides sp. zg-579]|uniref:EfeO-type cupredoxin-like domain-containing protein n=1 Tax=Nocardioides marmotae TaxID=2663857 RepID=A0A6I3J7V4_9ACTN|nr:hypothetical protein [Nocardioides marmotae]MCR6030653.1 hypothetical protein [Gordonia jinghuaiqii]MTB94289.1 hypothetical protein [Nocardioides marmotae]QKE00564.1 hypothetical protein HPC71_05325 [Nocardioides marmotae]